MDKNPTLVSYNIFKSFDELLVFTTTKSTLEIENVKFGDARENIAALADVFHISTSALVFPKQTHTNCVVEIDGIATPCLDGTDALITNRAGLCLCVQTADCVPVLLFDPVKKVVSAVHAGWRGTVEKITELAVLKMVETYGCKPDNILAAIGPSISSENYEVGNEVVTAARKSIPNVEETLFKNSSDNFHFNLWEANRQLLLQSGVPEDNIEIFGECSFQKSEKYFSVRREGVDTGRMVSGIMLM